MPNYWRTTLAFFVATSGAAYAEQTIRFDGARSEHIAAFCGGDGYETSSAYSAWMSTSLNQARAAGINDRDAIAALELSHCLPAMWADMTPTEKGQFCKDGELVPAYSVRLNKVLREAQQAGLEAPEAIAVIRSVHCNEPL